MDALTIGSSFDWISPLLNWLQGYTHATVIGVSFEEAVIEQWRLKEERVKSRIEGSFGNYRVLVKG